MSKQYEDDDGRTIADMSEVGARSVFSGLLTTENSVLRRSRRRSSLEEQSSSSREHSAPGHSLPGHSSQEYSGQSSFTQSKKSVSSYVSVDRKERRMYIFGAIGAGLLVVLLLLAGFAVVILLILWIGGVL